MTPKIPAEPRPPLRLILAKDQPQYLQLPVLYYDGTNEAGMTSEWEPTVEELALLLDGGRIRMTQLTFGHPFQPVQLQVVPAPCPMEEGSDGKP